MIIFGGLVAALLIVRPRGLLDERLVHRIGQLFRHHQPDTKLASEPRSANVRTKRGP
jgi:hypothetical protein